MQMSSNRPATQRQNRPSHVTILPSAFHLRFAGGCPCASPAASLVFYSERLPAVLTNTQTRELAPQWVCGWLNPGGKLSAHHSLSYPLDVLHHLVDKWSVDLELLSVGTIWSIVKRSNSTAELHLQGLVTSSGHVTSNATETVLWSQILTPLSHSCL